MRRRPEADEEFEQFVVDAYDHLVRFGALLVGDRPGGEDLTQTALLKVYRAWPRLEHKAAAAAYTRTTMVREAARWRRRRSSGEIPTGVPWDGPSERDGDESLAVAEQVRVALLSLPVTQRAVLLLRYFDGRSEAEIAELLGVSPGTVKSRSARGLATLRDVGLVARNDPMPEQSR